MNAFVISASLFLALGLASATADTTVYGFYSESCFETKDKARDYGVKPTRKAVRLALGGCKLISIKERGADNCKSCKDMNGKPSGYACQGYVVAVCKK